MTRKLSLQKAVEHHLAGRFQQAEAIYWQVLKKEPKNADALHLAGVLAHQGEKNQVAVELIRRAIACKPAFPEAYCNLGNVLKVQGEIEAAIGSYRSAIALKPDLVGAHNNLGNILRGLGRLEQAIVCYREALTYKPDHADAHYNLAIALKEQGKLVEAVHVR